MGDEAIRFRLFGQYTGKVVTDEGETALPKN